MPERANPVGPQRIVPPISLRRRITDHVMTGVAVVTVILVLVPLIAIFGYLLYRGVGSINWAFLTQTPRPVGEPAAGWPMPSWARASSLGLRAWLACRSE